MGRRPAPSIARAGARLELEEEERADPISPASHAVHRVVRALDLIVRAGGFGVAAIDLADVPARSLQALPFTTWRRLAHANEGQATVCLLVGRVAIGRSARGASVEPAPRRAGRDRAGRAGGSPGSTCRRASDECKG